MRVCVRARIPNLIVHLPLQLNNLVLHARVELLQVLSRTRLDLQLLQLPLGSHAPERALDDDGGGPCPQELLPLQPAADHLLDDHSFVVQQELRWGKGTHRQERVSDLPQEREREVETIQDVPAEIDDGSPPVLSIPAN